MNASTRATNRNMNPAAFFRRLARLAQDAEAYGEDEEDIAALGLAKHLADLEHWYAVAHEAIQDAKDIASAEVLRLRAVSRVEGGP